MMSWPRLSAFCSMDLTWESYCCVMESADPLVLPVPPSEPESGLSMTR